MAFHNSMMGVNASGMKLEAIASRYSRCPLYRVSQIFIRGNVSGGGPYYAAGRAASQNDHDMPAVARQGDCTPAPSQ